MFALSSFSQEVIMDRIEGGVRYLKTSSKVCYFKLAKYRFNLCAYESTTGVKWFLQISSKYYAPTSSEVLFKLQNEDLVHLYCNDVSVGKITKEGYGISCGNITVITPPEEIDYYTSSYQIDSDDLNMIERYGIKKLRISYGTEVGDKKFHCNTFGRFLKKSRRNIEQRFQKSPTQRDITEDF